MCTAKPSVTANAAPSRISGSASALERQAAVPHAEAVGHDGGDAQPEAERRHPGVRATPRTCFLHDRPGIALSVRLLPVEPDQ